MTSWRILTGDVRDTLPTLPDRSVQTCITSPPYYGLRDYGVDGQLGLEQTPDHYVQALVAVFREVRRVLADDGTLWLNLGDSYARDGGAVTAPGATAQAGNTLANVDTRSAERAKSLGLKPKDLIGIPWRVAFALQADGWTLRQDIIWHKPNPMPESVTDRCTKAHEYLFLLSKSERYYFDPLAMREPGVIPAGTKAAKGSAERKAQFNVNSRPAEYKIYDGTRNRRSVWTVQTRPYAGAHFATFQPALIEPCVLAGSCAGDVVLDPFTGSGTTGAVAVQHGRSFIGCELNPEYVALARTRIRDVNSLFAQEAS